MSSILIKQLVDKIRDEMQSLDGEEVEQIKGHFKNSLAHVQYAHESNGALYEGVVTN